MTAATLGQARISHRFLWLAEDDHRQRMNDIDTRSALGEAQANRIREAMAALATCRQDLERRFPELVSEECPTAVSPALSKMNNE